MSWYAKKSAGHGQGLVISEGDGRNVAVAYDVEDTPLLAAAPDLLTALVGVSEYWEGKPGGMPSELWVKIRHAIAKAYEGVA